MKGEEMVEMQREMNVLRLGSRFSLLSRNPLCGRARTFNTPRAIGPLRQVESPRFETLGRALTSFRPGRKREMQ